MAGEYNKVDAAKDTGRSTSEVSRAWHTARDDAAKEGGWGVPDNRHDESSSDKDSSSSNWGSEGSNDSSK